MNDSDYSDIINIPYPSESRTGRDGVALPPRMSMAQRAAQFAPFAALVGHDVMISETARITDSQLELDDERTLQLNQKMVMLRDLLPECPPITVTFFEPDSNKAGGTYRSVCGRLRNIDDYSRQLILTDGTIIPIDNVFDIL